MSAPTRWLFADQLGPHFVDDHDGPFLVVESRAVFRRRTFHRQKAHLVLSAMRHRVAELREAGRDVTFLQTDTYREALAQVDGPLQVVHPTSHAALRFVRRIAEQRDLEILPPRGFVTAREDFTRWAEGRGSKRLLMEDFYRDARRRHGVLLEDDGEPVGGSWNYDADNRESPPKGATTLGVDEPWWPERGRRSTTRYAETSTRWASDGRTGISFLGLRRAPSLLRHAGRGADRAGRLPRPPARAVRHLRGRRARRRPVDGPLADLGPPQPRAARPAGRRTPGRGAAPLRRCAAGQRRGVRAAGDGLARLRVAPLLAPRRGLPPPQRARRRAGACRTGSPSSTARRRRRAACPAPSTTSTGTAGSTTSRG